MCSTTRGPAIWPSLVTWPTSITATPRFLASRTSSPAQARTWVTEPGPASCMSLQSVCTESITTRSKRSRFRPSTMSRSAVSAASCTGASARPMPLGAGADLLDRLLAGDVGAARAAPGRLGADLQQQGRFADARIAGQQDRRAGHDAAAADPVELLEPR